MLSLILMSLLISSSLQAQKYLEVPVKVDIENGKVDDVLIKVVKNGKPVFTQSSVSKMKLKLTFNSTYTIIFTKPGYITKSIEFNTKAPADHIADGFDPYKIGVKLFKQYDGVNLTVYNQPVGKILFDKDLDEFSYDTDYSKSILSNLQEAEEKLAAKAEEEKRTGETLATVTETHTPNIDSSTVTDSSNSMKNIEQANVPSIQQDPLPVKTVNTGKDNAAKTVGSGGEQTKDYLAMDGSNDIGSGILNNQGNDASVTNHHDSGADPGQGKLNNKDGTDALPAIPIYNESEKITREDIVEKNRIITLIKVTRGKSTTEYRRVNYRWGGPFYFKNDVSSISENIFVLATGVND